MLGLVRNLSAGQRLLLGIPPGPGPFDVSVHALVALLAVHGLLSVATQWALLGPDAGFDPWGLAEYSLTTVTLLLGGYLAALASGLPQVLLRLPITLLAATPLLALLNAILVALPDGLPPPGSRSAWWALALAWCYAAYRALGIAARLRVPVRVAAAAALAAALVLPQVLLPTQGFFWRPPEQAAAAEDPRLNLGFDPEAVIYGQAELLAARLATLQPQRPSQPDLYFLGFAGYAEQDVFMKEVLWARGLFEQRFGARGRSLVLVNHAGTLDREPLASVSNLRQAIAGIGQQRDRNEDVLFLFLTSHGSADHRLAVRLHPMPFNDLDPEALAEMLRDSGIRWRVIVVSACYSGGFIEPLRDPQSIVITAARDDRTSFGCSDDAEFTYFGRALFADALSATDDLAAAFDRARRQVAAWEAESDYPASLPQMVVGEEIAPRLAGLLNSTARGVACAETVRAQEGGGCR